MALRSILRHDNSEAPPREKIVAPVDMVARGQVLQRLQVGLFGLGAMLLLIGVANVFLQRAQLVEDASVPEAAPTTSAQVDAPQQSDPLADAGVVPELPADPEEAPAPAAGGNGGAATGQIQNQGQNQGQGNGNNAESDGAAQP